MKTTRHGSRSDVQRSVELEVLEALSKQFGCHFSGGRVNTGRSYVEIDGMARDPIDGSYTLVEVFAHVGKVKAAQRHKVHADVLKLALARTVLQEAGASSVRALVAFVCVNCAKSLLGKTWVADSAERFGVDVVIVPISETSHGNLLTVQAKQNLMIEEK